MIGTNFIQRMKATTAAWGLDALHPLPRILQETRKCKLVTRSVRGAVMARTVRLLDWSLGHNANLWFVIAKSSAVAHDLRRDPRVTVEIADPAARMPIRLVGKAEVIGDRPSPVYLHPSVSSPTVKVYAQPLDFMFIKVDLRGSGTSHAEGARLFH